MIAAQAYQESGIDQSKRSPAGAIGVMQLLPSTAADPNVNIRKIEVMKHNIHAGVKYLRFLHDRYFKNEPMDALNKMLFAFASYNAGPGRIIKLRQEAGQSGFNPNIWFRNVEIMAARQIGRETVQYVGNIYKYYIAYRRIVKDFGQKKERKSGQI
jgi:membrane-bound lytic murein transglycosylase MltF